MATKSDTQNLSALVINRVASNAVFQDMISNDQVNPNELYLIEGDPTSSYVMTFTTSSWSNQTLQVAASTHKCGTNPAVQVFVLNGSNYERYYGYPSNGWKVSIDSSGNITLSVSASGNEFNGKIVVLKSGGDSPYVAPFAVRQNILDNAYFVGGGSQQRGGQFPINQRGSATYSPSATQYTIDRWTLRIYGSTVLSCDADGLSLTSGGSSFQAIMQSIENGKASLAGKTVTLSALITHNDFDSNTYLSLTNGSSAIAAGTYLLMEPINRVGLISATVTVPESLSNNYVNVVISFNGTSGKKLTIAAVKLELGNTQTLAHQENGEWVLNEIPNYTEQLERCQRFFIEINSTRNAYCKPGMGYANSSTAAKVFIAHPTMRTTPSVSCVGNWVLEDAQQNYKTVSAMSLDTTSATGSMLNITASSMTTGSFYALMANNSSTANIYLSADL